MRRAPCPCVCVLLVSLDGCGASSTGSKSSSTRASGRESSAERTLVPPAGVVVLSIEPPAAVVRAGGARLAKFKLGRAVAADSGCLACHRIGEEGTAGPGPDLTHVGSRLSRRRIQRALLKPTAPMPSFANLPKAKYRALVAFLALLR